jgi:hypothetical protein
MPMKTQDATQKPYRSGRRAIKELGLNRQESELHNLAVYIYCLEHENASLRQRVRLLSPMQEPVLAAA